MPRRARACRFTEPYSREIYLDGKPFITIHRPVNAHGNGPRPTDVDTVSHEIKKLLCGEKKTKSQFAGPLDAIARLFKKKPKPRVGDKTIYWFPGPGAGRGMTKRGYGVMSGARRRRRRRR